MNTLRLGIIGLGNIGRFHAGYVLEGKVARCELAALCSRNSMAAADFKAKAAAIKVFEEESELMRSNSVDAVLVATPHWQHPASGIAAFDAGLHVMVEKPIAAHKADAERFIAAQQRHPKCVFGVMSQLRAEPRYQKM